MAKNDGGPAFPVSWMDRDSTGEQVVREQWGGMSLRKWLAGMALVGALSSGKEELEQGGFDTDAIADWCVEMADAVLARLAKEE